MNFAKGNLINAGKYFFTVFVDRLRYALIILRIWMVSIILDSSVNFRKLSSKVTKLDGTNLVTSVTSISTTHIWLQEYLLQVHRRISFVHNFGNRYSMITLLRVFLLVLVFSDYTQPRAQSTKNYP